MPAINLSPLASRSVHTLMPRKLSTGAQAGIAVACALFVIALVGFLTFFLFRRHRAKHLAAIEDERARLANEKKSEKKKSENTDGAKPLPKRNKSIKDRLKGPLYNDDLEMPPTDISVQPLPHKPWAESSPRPSFSSRRGTKLMMMM